MANRNYPNAGKVYQFHVKPVLVTCNFVVDSTNGNGLGIRSLKGSGVANVFMHTSAPLAGSGNPNPASGLIQVILADNYNKYLHGTSGFVSPLSGSNLAVNVTALTIGQAYTVTVLGTTTAAQWITLGIAASIANSSTGVQVGTSFIALATGSGGTGQVQLASGSGIVSIEVVGDPNMSIAPVGTPGNGAQFILQCLGATNSSTTTLIPKAPADGTVIALTFAMNDSAVPAGAAGAT